MSDNIIRFPGFLLSEDRNTVFKDGNRYKGMGPLIADLPHQDLKRTYDWYCSRQYPSSYRERTLRIALYGHPLQRQQGGAA